jgi:hypothetical protein
MKRQTKRIADFKARLEKEKKERRTRPRAVIKPRYDEVFFEGTAWLDGLARGDYPE